MLTGTASDPPAPVSRDHRSCRVLSRSDRYPNWPNLGFVTGFRVLRARHPRPCCLPVAATRADLPARAPAQLVLPACPPTQLSWSMQQPEPRVELIIFLDAHEKLDSHTSHYHSSPSLRQCHTKHILCSMSQDKSHRDSHSSFAPSVSRDPIDQSKL